MEPPLGPAITPSPPAGASDPRPRWVAKRRFKARSLLPALLGLGGLVLIVAVISVIGVLHALRVEHRLQGLTKTVQVAQTEVEQRHLGAARAQLDALEGQLSSINSSLYSSPDFRLLDILPVAHQNLAAVRSSVHLALNVIGGGQQIFNAAAPLESATGRLDLSLNGGRVPSTALQAVQGAVASVVNTLPTSPVPPKQSYLLGRVRSREKTLWAEAARQRGQLVTLTSSLQIVNELTGGNGPRRYLIAVANTAEMRGAGGMILSYGILNAAGGKISLGKFGPIADLALTHPAKATFPADFMKTYAALHPNQFFQEATIMSDFTLDAPVLESMFTQATGLPVNGVIQVDPAGLGAILAGTGPILDPRLGPVATSNVVPLTLNTAYLAFPNRSTRQGYLSDVGREAFAALTSAQIPSLRPLGTALFAATKARHIILASTDSKTQGAIRDIGAAGSLPGPKADFAQLTVQNFGANKLDYYLFSSMNITGTRPGGGPVGHLSASIDLVNVAPPSRLSQFIFGPGPNKADPPGEYRGLVTLYLPEGTHLASSQITSVVGGASGARPGTNTQNGLRTVTFLVTLPAFSHLHVVLNVDLPGRKAGPEHFTIVPTPRVQSTVTSVKLS
ncbi:MAG: DUF4012 domain-containing protein [Actinomycetota bacterium]|nr:DUF4012 domain-containing protein [Actinomycetota bacterium]